MKKINSEIKLEFPSLKAKWGTVDKKNPTSIYLEIGTYIAPKSEEENYAKNIRLIDKQGKELIRNKLIGNNILGNDFIFVTDVSESRICYGKKSYLSIQIHFSNKNSSCKNFKDLVSSLEKPFETTCDEISGIISNNGFDQFKTKK